MTALFFKSLHLCYRDMHWNSIEGAQAGFCAHKKKLLKGEVVLLFTAYGKTLK